MTNVLLGVTGSVAATRTPRLTQALIEAGFGVQVVATERSLYFFDVEECPCPVIRDADEWANQQYQRGDSVPHIALRDWADLFVIAPIDANTLAKLAVGLCDNALTCVWRAWDMAKPIMLAPAMNTTMWELPFTAKHLRMIGADFGAGHVPGHLALPDLIRQINDRSKRMRIIEPIVKGLACGDVGIGAMAEVEDIVQRVVDFYAKTTT